MPVLRGHRLRYANAGPVGGRMLLVVFAAFGAGAGMALGGGLALVGLAVAGGVVALTIFFTFRIARTAQAAIALCEQDAVPPQSLHEALERIGHRMRAIGYRSDTRNPVTGLPTREWLFADLDHELAAGACGSLLGVVQLIDHDRVAAFDQSGANRLLTAFAARLAGAIDPRNMIAQIDRDCFAIWIRAKTSDAPSPMAELSALTYVAAQDIIIDGSTVTPTIAIGTAEPGSADESADQLLARAVAMLSRAEEPGTARRTEAEPQVGHAIRDRFVLEQGLVHAIAEDQLFLLFQPVLDLSIGRIVGTEALLRWRHPQLGVVSPAQFIPVMEAIGLSDQFGLWVLNAACRQARTWQDSGVAGMKMAVNLSARQFHDRALPVKVGRILARHGLSPRMLELELTETAAMADIDRTREQFAAFHALGVSLAIDDFGAGYSSLSYLKNLPFDKLKIDREFVTDVHVRRDSQAICRALIALARGLDLAVLAEGTESVDEVRALSALGCNLFQGFVIARPMPGEDVIALTGDQGWAARLLTPAHLRFPLVEGRVSA